MQRLLFFVYGVFCYLLFQITYPYLACFVGNLLVPKTIDSPTSTPVAWAVLVDVLLVLLFASQHSIMARPAFKRLWTRLVPTPIERSTYVLLSCAALAILMIGWRSIDTIVWDVRQPVLRGTLWVLFGIGWMTVPAVSLIIDHFELFGIRQVWSYLRGREYQPQPFRLRSLYRHVRHPLYVGFAIGMWATPTMSLGHLLFAATLTGYMVLAATVEERDLVAHFGRQYEDYRRRVPMFVPRLRPADAVNPSAPIPQPVEAK
jgi:protein-S-isoprenylcysteine O-methyltransferase Ste14